MSEMQWVAPKALVGLPGMPSTVRGVHSRAQQYEWERRIRTGRGGGYEYHVASLPAETRSALSTRQTPPTRAGEIGPGAVDGRRLAIRATMQHRRNAVTRQTTANDYLKLSDKKRLAADAKVAVLDALRRFQAESGLAGRRGIDAFVARYNDLQIDVEDWVREQEPALSRASVYRWKRRFETEGVAALGGKHQGQAGRSLIDSQPALREYVIAFLTEYPDTTASNVMRAVRARFANSDVQLPSRRRLEIWVTRWKQDNKNLFTSVTNPDAWKNKFMAAFGSYSEDVTRLNQRWELDSTPADVMLLDGRYSVVGAIDVYSRRPRLLVSRTSKASAVGQLLRRCLLEWGVPEEIKTDNGSDYASRYIRTVVSSLGIEQSFCQPFSGWEKPHIERFFRTFSHDLVELLPGYIGHNVAERSAIEARRSFADRLYQKDQAVEIRMTAQEFQAFADDWINNLYMQQRHAGMNDTPINRVVNWVEPVRAIDNERALDVLLAGAPDTETRTVTKKGLRIDGINYIAAELGSVIGQTVRVAYTESLGAVYVFTDDGFLCVAEAPEYTGIDRQEVAAHAKVIQRETLQQKRRELKATARRLKTKDAADEILAHARQQPNIAQLPPRTEQYSTDALRQAGRAADATTVTPVEARDDDTRAAVERLRGEMATPRKADVVPMNDDPKAEYRRWLSLDGRVRGGQRLSQEEKAFYEGYPKTSAYRSMKDFFERFGLAAKEG
ncbi:DNA-binding protein [Alloalcanivorax xenomutans]|uniref:DDE-type integrase/transposase/recombinase n=1 Tax=Alloalcanivorax xenomutans TaxID=1094342 RepID=A0A9Q3ZI30_9GAMM|nr:DNA-binding protein [Alloalcanivorax xenomutans]MCE7510272.1 DDE-type integrase/transposase/recombinase [Alloalcanivorax xenomutans]